MIFSTQWGLSNRALFFGLTKGIHCWSQWLIPSPRELHLRVKGWPRIALHSQRWRSNKACYFVTILPKNVSIILFLQLHSPPISMSGLSVKLDPIEDFPRRYKRLPLWTKIRMNATLKKSKQVPRPPSFLYLSHTVSFMVYIVTSVHA